jgi:hypothetical protein
VVEYRDGRPAFVFLSPDDKWRLHVTLDRVDPKGNWEARLAKVPMPAVATDVGWQLAVVIRGDKDGATIGLKGGVTGHIPFSEMRWARPRRDNGHFGPYPRAAADCKPAMSWWWNR